MNDVEPAAGVVPHRSLRSGLWIPDLCLLEIANALRKQFVTDGRFTRRHLADLLALGPGRGEQPCSCRRDPRVRRQPHDVRRGLSGAG